MDNNKLLSVDTESFNRDISIIDIATELGYDLSKSGPNYVAPCPICQDEGRKRHLTFYPQKNNFICHKCGKFKGNNFGLISKSLDTDSNRTFQWIKEHYSHVLTKSFPKTNKATIPIEPSPSFRPALKSDLHQEAFQYLYSLLTVPPVIQEYLNINRGMNNGTINRFGIRGISGTHHSIERELQKRYNIDDLTRIGLYCQVQGKRPYFAFYDDCVVFPHYYRGKMIYLSCRNLNLKIKSFNLPGKEYFNLDVLATSKIVYVFEGIINGLSYYQLTGKDNFIATLGIISEDAYVRLTTSFPEIDFRFAYDPDPPGLEAAQKYKADTQFYPKLFRKFGFSSVYSVPGKDGKPKIWDLNDLLVWRRDIYEEKAAILEFDQGLTRAEAESRAWKEVDCLDCDGIN